MLPSTGVRVRFISAREWPDWLQRAGSIPVGSTSSSRPDIQASGLLRGSRAMTEFRNDSGLKFVDISSEAVREYVFSDEKKVTINFPLWMNVSSSGGHRVFDVNGISHYIPKGWHHLSWKAKDGRPHFVK